MSYVPPIKDRALSDVTTPTSKGYFNVADFTRIYGNAKLASGLAAAMLGTPIAFTVIAVPTTTKNATTILADLNTLLGNIEVLRLAVAGESIPGTTAEIKDDYVAGPTQPAPDYINVNLWESTVDAIWDNWNGDSLEVCPDLAGDVVVGNGETKIYVDCVNTNGHTITINGTGVLYVI
ncbi:MAG: hypothetical protein EHM33_00910 [Chloroflexi bacterium]|nr:MAG: hypothetical protein EHM33_00910 [Chloroflexota bacterium]